MKLQSIKIVKKNESISNIVDYISDSLPQGNRKFGYSWCGPNAKNISNWLDTLPLIRGGVVMKHDLAVRKVPKSEQYHYGDDNPIYLYITEDYLNSILGNLEITILTTKEKTSVVKTYIPEAKGLYLMQVSNTMYGHTLFELLETKFFDNRYDNKVTSIEKLETIIKRVNLYKEFTSSLAIRLKLSYREASSARLYFQHVSSEGIVTDLEDAGLDYAQTKQIVSLMDVKPIDNDEYPKENQIFTKTIPLVSGLSELQAIVNGLENQAIKNQGGEV